MGSYMFSSGQGQGHMTTGLKCPLNGKFRMITMENAESGGLLARFSFLVDFVPFSLFLARALPIPYSQKTSSSSFSFSTEFPHLRV
jgi:hypothetical protein